MDMTFLIADSNRYELGELGYTDELDLEMNGHDSKNNDFELAVARSSDSLRHIGIGGYIYAPGTAYGGCIEESDAASNEKVIYYRGLNWLGFLCADVVEPPGGQDYRTFSGEANACIAEMVEHTLGGMFTVSTEDSGITIKSYQARYCTVLEALQKMLKTAGARLNIETVQEEGTFRIRLSAVPIQNLCEEVTYNEDNRINLRIQDMRWGINHLICLGRGELKDRLVVHLYLQPNGSVGRTQYYQGFRERKAIYDYSSAQSEEDLVEKGTERLLDICSYNNMEVTVEDVDLAIGDIVGGKDIATGVSLQKPIIKKILKLQKGSVSIEYRVEGEN